MPVPAMRWLLPEGMREVLPPQSWRLEQLRRALLDEFQRWGYELVFPPLLEYLESLLTGTGSDLELETFKVIDPYSGRLLGIRADMTPQLARIDAHRLQNPWPTRLCYSGSVLHTQVQTGLGRSPWQIGAELFGAAGPESDGEILALMLTTLRRAGANTIQLELGHVGIFRTLAQQAGLSPDQERCLFAALQRKAEPEINALVRTLPTALQAAFAALPELTGDVAVLDSARQRLAGGGPAVQTALDTLQQIHAHLKLHDPDVALTFDLAELRGYHYHTGATYAAFAPGFAVELARGGRYDAIGQSFGAARPATGFSADLHALLRLCPDPDTPGAIYAPASTDPALWQRVQQLRQQGHRVLSALTEDGDPRQLGCDRCLTQDTTRAWIIRPL